MPRPIPLPDPAYLAVCFEFIVTTGELRWRKRPRSHFTDDMHFHTWNGRYPGTIAGWKQVAGYQAVAVAGHKYLVHRIIWKITRGTEPPSLLDHKNSSRSDNRPSNIRGATDTQNLANARTRSDSLSGVKGVRRLPGGKFQAHISLCRRFRSLGTFWTAEEAHAAYCVAAHKAYGEFFNAG